MTDTPNRRSRRRRRAVRISEAADYDRAAESSTFLSAFDSDTSEDLRVVDLSGPGDFLTEPAEDTEDPSQRSRQFWEELKPPHYGE